MNQRTTKIGHRKLRQANIGGAYAAAYSIIKLRSVEESDGSSGEQVYTQLAYLLTLPGDERKLWLTPKELRRVIAVLEQVEGPEEGVSTEAPAASALSIEQQGEAEPTFLQRLQVHRLIEWMRQHDTLPEPWELADDAVAALAAAGIDMPADAAVARLLIEEVHRSMGQQVRMLADGRELNWLQVQEVQQRRCPVPADPLGELEGGRTRVAALLYRRVKARPTRGSKPLGGDATASQGHEGLLARRAPQAESDMASGRAYGRAGATGDKTPV